MAAIQQDECEFGWNEYHRPTNDTLYTAQR